MIILRPIFGFSPTVLIFIIHHNVSSMRRASHSAAELPKCTAAAARAQILTETAPVIADPVTRTMCMTTHVEIMLS
jgi:hypothetical protein